DIEAHLRLLLPLSFGMPKQDRIILEYVQAGHVHGVRARPDISPELRVELSTFMQNPKQQSYCQIAIIAEVPRIIATTHRVINVELIVALNELVTQRTRLASAVADTRIF